MILTAFEVANCDPQLNAPIQLPANLAVEGCQKYYAPTGTANQRLLCRFLRAKKRRILKTHLVTRRVIKSPRIPLKLAASAHRTPTPSAHPTVKFQTIEQSVKECSSRRPSRLAVQTVAVHSPFCHARDH